MHKLARSRDARQAGLAFVATMLPNVFYFLYHVVMSRQLGVDRYGALSSLNSFLVLTSVPAAIATIVIMKYTAEFKAVEDWAKLRGFATRAITLGAVCAAGLALGVIAARDAIGAYLQIHDGTVVAITGAALGINIVLPLARGVIQGLQDFGKLAISASIDALGRAVFGVLLVQMGFGLGGAVAGIAIACGLSLAYTLYACLKPLGRESAPLHIDLRRLIQSSAGVALSTLFVTVLGFSDLPLVKHFFDAHDAGLYGAASLAGKMVLYALGFVPLLVLPKAASRRARGDTSPLVWLSALGITAAIALPVLLVLAVLPAIVLKILTGGAFLEAAPLLLPYGLAMAFMAGCNALVAFNIGSHRFEYLFPLCLAAAAEVVAIQFFHASLGQVLQILVFANLAAFLGVAACSLLPAPLRRPVPAPTGRPST